MTVVDARSGKYVRVGDTVDYGDDAWMLLAVSDLILTATAIIARKGYVEKVKMPVRFLHPAFLFKRVAFFPS